MTVLFIALTLDILLGEAPDRLHPVCFMGRWAEICEPIFRTFFAQHPILPEFSGSNRLSTTLAGTLAALTGTLPFTLAALPVLWLPPLWAELFAGFLVYLCLAPRALAEHAAAVARPLENNDLPAARVAVSRMVGRETANLDAHGVARAAVESVGENLVDGVLATLFWAAAGMALGSVLFPHSPALAPALGAALALFHRGINTLDAMWGKRNERYIRFGTFAARLDDVLAFLPARLSLPVIAIAAATLLGRSAFFDALRVGYSDRAALASPNSGWSEAPFAGALQLRLGGPLYYAGTLRDAPYMGTGTPDATPGHIRNAIGLMWRSVVLFGLLMGSLGMM